MLNYYNELQKNEEYFGIHYTSTNEYNVAYVLHHFINVFVT